MIFCGDIQVESRFFLAPMAGVTDLAFRSVCAEMGAALTYTEMVSAKALTYNDAKSRGMLVLREGDVVCIPQIFGSDPEVMAEGARIALEVSKAPAIDINMGCPVSKITGNGEGSALMRDMYRAENIIKAVKRAVHVPVTVKFRKGYESGSFTCVEFAKMAEQAGADAMCVHGRTKTQMYSGLSDPYAVEAVKKAVSVPVIASGDALSAEKCLHILDVTGADFIMIARGAEGNPFILEDCLALASGFRVEERSVSDILSVMLRHARYACRFKGESKAMTEFRKHGLWYLNRLSGVKAFKVKMSGISDYAGLEELCLEIGASNARVKEA